MSSAALGTRITDRVNALVWRLPLPRRVLVRLSGLVYRNPPMSADRVYETVDALSQAGIEAWCMGGWGADALVGRQTRKHRDLDLIVDGEHEAAALEVLRGLSYEEWFRGRCPAGFWYGGTSGREHEDDEQEVAVRDSALRAIDLHFISMARSGLTSAPGSIDGRRVRCLSAESQFRAYESYLVREGHEHRNVALIRQAASRGTAPDAPSISDAPTGA